MRILHTVVKILIVSCEGRNKSTRAWFAVQWCPMYITKGPHTCTSLTLLSWRTRLGAGLFIYIFICHGDPYHLLFELPAGSSQKRKWNCQSTRSDRIEKSIPKPSLKTTQPPNQSATSCKFPDSALPADVAGCWIIVLLMCYSPLQPPAAANNFTLAIWVALQDHSMAAHLLHKWKDGRTL